MKQQIAASLEQAFSRYGFADPSVAQLKAACNVSLRTLYKHYPSKEAMIVAALEYRHQRYLAWLAPGGNEAKSVAQLFDKLGEWMRQFAPHGCLSLNALAAYPDNQLIINVVNSHKLAVKLLLAEQSQRADLAEALFLLHEGVSSAWPFQGDNAISAAQSMLALLLREQSQ
ncbi:TetR/AcrR family transcriptional regulator [Shewanella waksmanii]|uniref:TetR/AcrR family transcriptional regulator n=1 Tax=Shewanella waksmanii TaxID=213783 RepID=UPI00048F3DBA|nr:TetR/AcrR family transcriptional regulator [Shewanella waksmanii]